MISVHNVATAHRSLHSMRSRRRASGGVLLWPLLLLLAGSSAARNNHVKLDNQAEVLADSLRRQLMNDSYDYERDSEERRPNAGGRNTFDTLLFRASQANARTATVMPTLQGDFLYYIDEELVVGRLGSHLRSGGATNASKQDAADAATKVKYSMLKMQPQRGFRRAGGAGGARRLIQEETAQGVAIIRLDDAPFPVFRLPRTRRQYMLAEDNARQDAAAATKPREDEQDAAKPHEEVQDAAKAREDQLV